MDLKHLSNSERISLIMGQLAGTLQAFHEGAQSESGVDFPALSKALSRLVDLIEEGQNSFREQVQ